jgi:hypothetical protein
VGPARCDHQVGAAVRRPAGGSGPSAEGRGQEAPKTALEVAGSAVVKLGAWGPEEQGAELRDQAGGRAGLRATSIPVWPLTTDL